MWAPNLPANMSEHFDALLASITGSPVLDPADLAAAIVEGEKDQRIGELSAALSTKPAPKIPPRYESEVRTWLARTTLTADPSGSRIQAYAAVHLDPNNAEAIRALDDAAAALGDDVRNNTWTALVTAYSDLAPIRDAAAAAGIDLPDPGLALRGDKRGGAKRQRKRREDSPVLESGEAGGKRKRPTGLAALVPALEPDPVVADRLAALHLICGAEWPLDAVDPEVPIASVDPLTWAQRRLAHASDSAPAEHAVGTGLVVTLRLEGAAAGDGRPGPLYGKLLKRLKGHPGAVRWAAEAQLGEGDAVGAQRSLQRLDAGLGPNPWSADLAELRARVDAAVAALPPEAVKAAHAAADADADAADATPSAAPAAEAVEVAEGAEGAADAPAVEAAEVAESAVAADPGDDTPPTDA